MVFQGDPGNEGDIGEPGPPGLTVRPQNNPDKTAGLNNFGCYCLTVFPCFFQGMNGNPGKPGPSGDPVRLLKAI